MHTDEEWLLQGPQQDISYNAISNRMQALGCGSYYEAPTRFVTREYFAPDPNITHIKVQNEISRPVTLPAGLVHMSCALRMPHDGNVASMLQGSKALESLDISVLNAVPMRTLPAGIKKLRMKNGVHTTKPPASVTSLSIVKARSLPTNVQSVVPDAVEDLVLDCSCDNAHVVEALPNTLRRLEMRDACFELRSLPSRLEELSLVMSSVEFEPGTLPPSLRRMRITVAAGAVVNLPESSVEVLALILKEGAVLGYMNFPNVKHVLVSGKSQQAHSFLRHLPHRNLVSLRMLDTKLEQKLCETIFNNTPNLESLHVTVCADSARWLDLRACQNLKRAVIHRDTFTLEPRRSWLGRLPVSVEYLQLEFAGFELRALFTELRYLVNLKHINLFIGVVDRGHDALFNVYTEWTKLECLEFTCDQHIDMDYDFCATFHDDTTLTARNAIKIDGAALANLKHVRMQVPAAVEIHA